MLSPLLCKGHKEGCCRVLLQAELATLSSLGQNFLLLRLGKYLLDEDPWRNWHPEGRSPSAPGLPGSNAILCHWHIMTGPPWAQAQAVRGAPQVWSLAQAASPSLHCRTLYKNPKVHFGILTSYFYLIHASGPQSCFASLLSPLTEGHKENTSKDSIFMSSSHVFKV